MESSDEAMRGQGMEFQDPNRGQYPKRWHSFQALNETFRFPSSQEEGCWIDYTRNDEIVPGWNKGMKTPEEIKERMRGPRGPLKKPRAPKSAEARQRISERQKGKKRGPYKKSSKVRKRDANGRFLKD